MVHCLPNLPNPKNHLGQLLKIYKTMQKRIWTLPQEILTQGALNGGQEPAFLTNVSSDFF